MPRAGQMDRQYKNLKLNRIMQRPSVELATGVGFFCYARFLLSQMQRPSVLLATTVGSMQRPSVLFVTGVGAVCSVIVFFSQCNARVPCMPRSLLMSVQSCALVIGPLGSAKGSINYHTNPRIPC